jgi:NADH-quinone oxidoreductase subunit M
VLLGAFSAAWPQWQTGDALPLVLAAAAVSGVVLGALYMLRFALGFLFGAAKAPQSPGHVLADLDLREKAILVAIVVGVFAIGLFPDEPMRKTELAAREYQRLTGTPRSPETVAAADAALRSPDAVLASGGLPIAAQSAAVIAKAPQEAPR